MYKENNLYLALIVLVTIIFSSCNKDDDSSSSSDFPNSKTTAVFNSKVTYGKLLDQDGNVYRTVTIDKQTWMAENLRTTKYNDGTEIPNITTAWKESNTGAYCAYNNTINIDTIATYGLLYNWFAVKSGKLAPKGWHVPTHEEWVKLSTYLGGQDVAQVKLKEKGSSHWIDSKFDATNETGFTAIPSGLRIDTFTYMGYFSYWWSATEMGTGSASGQLMSNVNILGFVGIKKLGLSVRCVKD